MPALRTTYKVLRSFLFTVILVAVTVYVGLYVVLSIPSVQKSVKERVERESSSFLKTKVEVGALKILPFSEVRLSDVVIHTPQGDKCVTVGALGVGINLWRLVYERKIEITYAEIMELDGRVWRQTPKSPLNIDFIIKALSPKEKNKPPVKFDLKLYNVVIRKSRLSYDVLDVPKKGNGNVFDSNHIVLNDFRADVALPRLRNDDFVIDLRRLSFSERSGFYVEKLGMIAHVTSTSIDVGDILLRLPGSEIKFSDINLKFRTLKEVKSSLDTGNHLLQVKAARLTPSDFRAFYLPLGELDGEYKFDADISGRTGDIMLEQFSLRSMRDDLILNVRGRLRGLPDIKSVNGDIDGFEFRTSAGNAGMILNLVPGLQHNISEVISRAEEISVALSGNISMPQRSSRFKTEIISGSGDISADCNLMWQSAKVFDISGNVTSEDLNIGKLLADNRLGTLSFTSSAEVNVRGKDIDAAGDIIVRQLYYNGETVNDISFSGVKSGNMITGYLTVDDESVSLEADADVTLDRDKSKWRLSADINNLIPSRYGIFPKYKGYNLTGSLTADLEGNSIDNMTGNIGINGVSFDKGGKDGVHISSLALTSQIEDSVKTYIIDSDFVKGKLEGDFTFAGLAAFSREMASVALPSLITFGNSGVRDDFASLSLTVSPNDEVARFLSLPVRPYTDVKINGFIEDKDGHAFVEFEAPFLVQGSSKMIRNTKISIRGDKTGGLKADIRSTLPAKNDDANLSLAVSAFSDNVLADVGWTFEKNKTADGQLELGASVSRDAVGGTPAVSLTVYPSSFRLNGSEWNIDRATLSYSGNILDVDNVRIWHAGQFLSINGRASASPLDALRVSLAGIDLSYIFEALNINYVTFGGMATGEIMASELFSKIPVLRTERLFVKDLSYNGAVLGDGNLESHWINDLKKVAINADVRRGNRRVALIGGGIYVGKDSLSFDMLADHVNIGFLKPFMSAFTSDVGGEASGRVKLYGTFKDVDLAGKVLADSICMKVDYTNVYYHGTDSVYIHPGHIEIPSFRLYDKYGNSALFKGYVKHRYFHEPEFEFRLSDASDLLCFDTNSKINPDWYGRIFASGGGSLRGRPGVVSMMLDVSTSPGSDFTFVLNDRQTASDYTFLTFTDRRKAEREASRDTVGDTENKAGMLMPASVAERPSLFSMDIRCSVTPDAKMNLIMDPKAGDRITARGGGPMQISYDTDSDEMLIYGKYTLDEGNYNFSLQDLILRDFKIYPGSNISFNGDPMQGVLDITAAYRVNTNLSDLDKSFSTDRDLNRTNVPVDALLKVNGGMRGPEISFDIALPTLTQDVERKVKSIISTDDMMNRQIIYLLALNRFYTPEYMGVTSNGSGELASVASSTLSSQLSNFMGQLTDKVTLAPSFRSDKGDFSDMEVDVALSSRLLNNRLLINGNFGYRDRATSQSTFVGDFDIEYLLNKNGNLRLKAYNHFNDQNYYLRSALTTQGIGVIYRRDFDNPFTFLKRRKKESANSMGSDKDSTQNK